MWANVHRSSQRGLMFVAQYVCNSSTNECESNNNVHCYATDAYTTTWVQLQHRCYRVAIIGAVAAVGIVAQTVTHSILPLLSPSPFQAMCASAIQLLHLKLCASDFWWIRLVRVCLFVFTYVCVRLRVWMNEWADGWMGVCICLLEFAFDNCFLDRFHAIVFPCSRLSTIDCRAPVHTSNFCTALMIR